MPDTPRVPVPCLLLLTDRTLLEPRWTLSQAIAPAVTGGVNLVVMGESDLPKGPRLTVARFVKDGVRSRVPLLMAGTAEFALAADADGVHLEDETSSVAEARALLGPGRLIGAACRTMEAARLAAANGADYVLVFYDWSAPEPALAHLRDVCQACSVPVIAALDMSPFQAAACRTAGASGVAISAPAMNTPDRTRAAHEYLQAIE